MRMSFFRFFSIFFLVFGTSCQTVSYEPSFDTSLFRMGEVYSVSGYLSYRPESYSLFPTEGMEALSDDCINLVNIDQFLSRGDNFKKVTIRLRFVPDPLKGRFALLQCRENSAEILEVVESAHSESSNKLNNP